MLRAFLFILILVLTPAISFASNSDVAISEVLFDPSGTDTGLEYVVIKNFGTSEVGLNGWDLYPAGVGYYAFPDFILAAGSEVKIHIRASGFDGAADLYHSSASGNIGNSSGSIALFSNTTHNKDMIVAFMRYHKPGSAESKTWESAASDSGIWSVGDFIDISNFSEGQILKLQHFNKKISSQGWSIENNVDSQISPASLQANSEDEDAQMPGAQSGGGGVVLMAESTSKIKTDAGEDRTALAGAEVVFDGMIGGVDGNSINNVRFLWNFGDGYTTEGKNLTHNFVFPGVYAITLTASLAGVSSSDSAKITVVENPVVISEIKPAAFVEIHNNSPRKIDFSGFGIQINGSKPFYFDSGTFLTPYAHLALEKGLLGFDIPHGAEVKLLYPSGKILFSSNYPDILLSEKESSSFIDSEWVKSKTTPGEKNEISKGTISKLQKSPVPVAERNVQLNASVKSGERSNGLQSNVAAVSPRISNLQPFFNGEYFWLVIGLGAGILGGLVFLFAKRYLA